MAEVQVLEFGAAGQFEQPFAEPPQRTVPLEFQRPPQSSGIKPDQVVTSDGTIYELRGDKYRETAPIVKPGQQTRDSIKPFRPKPARPPLRGTAPAGNVTTLLNELAGSSGGLSPSNEKIIDDMGDWLTGLGTGLIESLNDLPRTETPLDNELTVHLEKGIGVGHLIGDAINDIQWPEIEAPEINWPELELPPIDIQWPEINWPELEWPDIEAPPINLPKPPEINWPWDWPEDDPIVEPPPEPDPEPEPEPPPTPEQPKPEDFPLLPPYGDSFTEEPDVSPDDFRTGWCRLRIEVSSTYVEAVYNLNVPSRNRDPYSQSYGPFERWAWIRGPMKKNLGSYKFFQLSHNPTSWSLVNFPYVAGTAYRVINPSRPDDPPLFPDANPNYRPVILGLEPQLIKLETLLINATSGSLDEYFFGDRRWQRWNSSVTIRWYCDGDGSGSSSPPPPLPEPPDNMSCSCDDLKRMLRSLKGKVKVPKVFCEQVEEDGVLIWKPRIEEEEIELIAIDEATLAGIAGHYTKLAEIQEAECNARNTRFTNVSIKIPVVTCSQVEENGVLIWKPELQEVDLEVPENQASSTLKLHQELALVAEAQCNARNWTDFSLVLPKSVLTPPDSNLFEQVWDWITPDETVEINTAPELIRWTIEQLSGMLGDWGQKIVIPGDEEGDGEFYIPDLATGITQILLKLQALQDDENAIVSLGTRSIFEAHMARQQGIQCNYGIEAILQFLAPKIKRDKVDIPATFSKPNPDEIDDIDTRQELENFLQNSTLPVPVIMYDDTRDLKDDLKPLLDAAGIIKAVLAVGYKKDASDEELGAMLRDLIKSRRADVDTFRNDEDWDAWVNKVEQGFTTEPGITDPINPYGRDLSRRPRIREIGTDQADV